jgi:SSS family solute:Na+ symporter
MNRWDYAVLIGTILSIAAYGTWQTSGRRDLRTYFQGREKTGWIAIGLSVMATQASAITFLSTPGQGFESGLGFVQNYFGAPLALILIAAVFLPLYRRLKVYTAYEFLGLRFDRRTRLLGAALFLIQRGLAAGITIYAPAIVLSALLGWRLDVTIIGCGLLVTAYTVVGGSEAVSVTQKYQLAVIFAGMAAAFVVLLARLPGGVTPGEAMTVAGGLHKLEAVDFSPDLSRRYTFWSGILGGFFLALSYFGTDQSQVQRYLQGASLRESRLGLMFNAVCKIPMQTFILLLGALIFVFYQFEPEPILFNRPAWRQQLARPGGEKLDELEHEFAQVHAEKRRVIQSWLEALRAGDRRRAAAALEKARADVRRGDAIRAEARERMRAAAKQTPANDADYVFITFILDHLPHGLIGLLVAAFFAATMSAKAAELNALGSTATIDFYRHLIRREASDAHYVAAAKCFTAFWGLAAIGFALFARLSENLIQAVNILGSLFYGVMLGLFLVAFFVRRVGGTAVFWAGVSAQVLVFVLYAALPISYLWYNLIGCAACVLFSLMIQFALGPPEPGSAEVAAP